MRSLALIGAYLGAIVLVNLTVALAPAEWRGSVVLFNSFVLIALDLTTRDKLHDLWRGWQRWSGMAALIGVGSLLSWLLNGAAGPVALVSCVAFALATLADTLAYGALRRQPWHIRANGSNVVSALIDSAVFLLGLALAGLLPWGSVPILIAGQWLAKVCGGALWSIVLRQRELVEA